MMASIPVAPELRSEKLGIRLSPPAKAKLQAAAIALQRSMSDFVVESALLRADEALADRRSFPVDGRQWKAFQVALDAPVRPMPRMKKLLNESDYFNKAS